MLRAMLFALLLTTGCHKDTNPPPMHPAQGELPPLPPSSGTAVGYLVDNAGQLQLTDDQLDKLKQIDRSLAAKNDGIETQLRLIEKPTEDPPAAQGAEQPRRNNAPGAQVRTTPDSARLHSERKANDAEALQQAFAVLEPGQQATARTLLEERGITPPGSPARKQSHASDDGVPPPLR